MTKRAEESRRYRQKNRAVLQQRRAVKSADPEFRRRERERNRRYRDASHGGRSYTEIVALMLEHQGGCCYLCGEKLVPEWTVLDHDHRCCPKGKTCDACRRGLACQRCNRLIGQLGDDPGALRRIADNLERAVEAARVRIAGKPVQLEINDASAT